MALSIDIERSEKTWKAKKFVIQEPGKDYGPNIMMDKTFYDYAQKDQFDDLFDELERAPSENQSSIIYTQVSPSGNSLLHVAASNGSKGVTELLALHFPSLITRKNFQGDTAVHLAARAGKLDIIEILVRQWRYLAGTSDPADGLLKMKNERGNTPLHDAVISGHADVAKYLASESPEVSHFKNKEEKSPLYLAVETSCTHEKKDDILEILLEAKATNDGKTFFTLEGKSPARAAVKQKKLDVLEKIADKRPDLIHVKDKEGGNPLHLASSMNYLEGVKFLLYNFRDCAIEKNQEGHYPIHVACKIGHVGVVEEMVKQWPDPTDFLNDKGQNILHVAGASGQKAVVKYILGNPKLEALTNQKDLDGNTPMHLAAMQGHPKAVFALAWDNRVDCNIANSEKQIAFFAALDIYQKEVDSENTNSNAKGDQYDSGRPNGGKKRSTTVTSSKIPYFGVGLATFILLFRTNVSGLETAKKMNKLSMEQRSLTRDELRSRIEVLLVVAVFVAAATYAGAIQMPEVGSSSSNVDNINSSSTSSATPNDTSINKTQKHFQNYVICGAVAFHTSILSAIVLCWALFCGVRLGSFAVRVASAFISYSIFFMGCAFTFAVGIAVFRYPATSWVYTLSYYFFLPLQVLLIIPLFLLSVQQVLCPFLFIFTLLLFGLLISRKFIEILGSKRKSCMQCLSLAIYSKMC